MSASHTGHVLHAAHHLCESMNHTIDEQMPEKLAGIVKTHAALAVGAAMVPLPGADVAAAVANCWAMYLRINKEIDIPFSENAVKSIALGIVTNLGTGMAGALALGTLAKFIPIGGTLVGTVVVGSTVYAMTLASSVIYMKALSKLLAGKIKNTGGLTEEDLKAAIKDTLKDKDLIKSVMDEAKANYRADKATDTKKEG